MAQNSSKKRCARASLRSADFSLKKDLAKKNYSQHLRPIKFHDTKHDKELVFLTNNFDFPALTIAQLYCCCWQVELFFKWIKQHLRIKRFYDVTQTQSKCKYGSPHCLRLGRYREKATQYPRFTLHNSTNSKSYSFRAAGYQGALTGFYVPLRPKPQIELADYL
jgi:hypothetical protein